MKRSRIVKVQLLRILRIKDSPHVIAGGVACGIATHYFPSFGFGPVLAILFSKMTKTSFVASLVGWGISSWAWPFLFMLNIRVGDQILGLPTALPRRHLPRLAHLSPAAWLTVGKSYLVGMVVNSIVTIALLTWLGGWLLGRYRLPIIHHVRKWQVSR